jgi:hypothetical protein
MDWQLGCPRRQWFGPDLALDHFRPQRTRIQWIAVENEAPVARGGETIAAMMKMSAHRLADKYVDTGGATVRDVALCCRFAADATSQAISHGVVRGLGQRR